LQLRVYRNFQSMSTFDGFIRHNNKCPDLILKKE
jgi:hypothetical protein